jgi:phosphoglycolate phosphatase
LIKLIMFDLDGTLVNSIVDITNALNYAIEPYNLEKMTAGRTVGMVGEGLTMLVKKMLGGENAAIMPDVMDRFMRYYSGLNSPCLIRVCLRRLKSCRITGRRWCRIRGRHCQRGS